MARQKNIMRLKFFLTLMLVVLWSLAAGRPSAYADVSGSALTDVSPEPLPVGTFGITFSVHFVSSDEEYMDRFDVTLPAGWTINSVGHTAGDSFCPDTIEGHDGQTIYWQRNAELPSNCGAWVGGDYTFTANVTIPSCPAGGVSLDWNILGDYFILADPPHTTSGSFSPGFSCSTTAPFAPSGVKAVPGDGQATVSFSPGYDGGSPITGYTVTSSPGSITATGSSSPIVVTGLTNGTAYTFVVAATNSIGTGPSSDPSNIATPWPGLTGSGDVPKQIPDNYPPGVASILTIAPGACSNISDLNAAVNVSHPWAGDLIVTLTHNNTGTSAIIFDIADGCTGGGVIDVLLDDAASLPVENECDAEIRGTFSPNNPLSVFNNEDAEGTWTLTVSDNAEGDVGSLNSWGLVLTCGAVNSFTLTVSKSGSGTVTSNPAGINCGSDCTESYASGTSVDLTATPSQSCTILTYSGACAGNSNPCSVTMSANKTVNVDFFTHYVWIEGTGYYGASLQNAYDAASSSNVLRSRVFQETGDLFFDSNKQVTIRGGFTDCSYSINTGGFTTINGSVTIGGPGSGTGSVTIANIAIQ